MKLFATFALFASSNATFARNNVEAMCTSCLSEPSDACWGACYSMASRSGTTVHDAIVVPQVRWIQNNLFSIFNFSALAAFRSHLMPAGEPATLLEPLSLTRRSIPCALAASPNHRMHAGELALDQPPLSLRSTRTSSRCSKA